MCCFYLGIAQIALDPPPLCQTGKRWKKVLQTILASLYLHPLFQAMPIRKQQKGLPYGWVLSIQFGKSTLFDFLLMHILFDNTDKNQETGLQIWDQFLAAGIQ